MQLATLALWILAEFTPIGKNFTLPIRVDPPSPLLDSTSCPTRLQKFQLCAGGPRTLFTGWQQRRSLRQRPSSTRPPSASSRSTVRPHIGPGPIAVKKKTGDLASKFFKILRHVRLIKKNQGIWLPSFSELYAMYGFKKGYLTPQFSKLYAMCGLKKGYLRGVFTNKVQ
jgi:hypothetical protein